MTQIPLPDTLVQQIQGYERRLKSIETLLAVAGGIAGLFITYVLLFVLDRFVDTPRVVRLLLFVAGAGFAAWFAQGWARDWLWKKRGPRDLAKLLQKHYRSLGDRLQGVIELSETGLLPANVSPALCRAAIKQVAEEAANHDFNNAVPTKPARKWALAAVVVAALSTAPFVLVPKAASNAGARWMAPLADIERYTFAGVSDMDPDIYPAHGEPFDVALSMKLDSAWNPDTAKARIGNQEEVTATFSDGRAIFNFPGQTKEGVLKIRVGDAAKEVAVHPLHRPELRQIVAHVMPPDYLGYEKSDQTVHGGMAEFLEGSTVSFEGTIARDLGAASMTAPEEELSAVLSGPSFTTDYRPVAELVGEVSFNWQDRHNLKPSQPYVLQVGQARDVEPRVDISNLAQESAILATEVVKFDMSASDDFGLKETWVGWSVRQTTGDKKVLSEEVANKVVGDPKKKDASGQIEFSPMWHKIPDDTVIEIAAYAVDYFPDRKPSSSWKHTLHVLSPAKHAEKIRERMDQILKELDDRIRDEERLLEENKAITERKEELGTEKAGENIKKTEVGERQNEEAVKKLAKDMEAIIGDAMRNKDINAKAIEDFNKIADQLQQKANPAQEKAAENMQQAAEQPQNREQEMKEAMEQQQAALDAMKDAAQKMNEANEDLYARNFYNRLRQAAQNERAVSENLKSLAKNTAGMKPEEIKPEQKKDFDNVATKQDATTTDVDGIVSDMGSFIARVPNDKYLSVHREMEEKRVVPELNDLAGFVRANLGLKSVGRARAWGEQLDAWASMLQDESKGESKPGEGEMDPELMKLLIAMVRAAQAEDTLREQTELLDKKKEGNEFHGGDSARLADLQDILAADIQKLREETKFEDVKPLLEAVEGMMGEVSEKLREPNTGKETVGLEGTIIEVLVPPDKKGSSSSPSQAMKKMQQMMQKMMARATKPGKNNSVNPSNLAAGPAEGEGAGQKSPNRTVEKSGGAGNAGEWPEEFRDELQSYFQSMEERGK